MPSCVDEKKSSARKRRERFRRSVLAGHSLLKPVSALREDDDVSFQWNVHAAEFVPPVRAALDSTYIMELQLQIAQTHSTLLNISAQLGALTYAAACDSSPSDGNFSMEGRLLPKYCSNLPFDATSNTYPDTPYTCGATDAAGNATTFVTPTCSLLDPEMGTPVDSNGQDCDAETSEPETTRAGAESVEEASCEPAPVEGDNQRLCRVLVPATATLCESCFLDCIPCTVTGPVLCKSCRALMWHAERRKLAKQVTHQVGLAFDINMHAWTLGRVCEWALDLNDKDAVTLVCNSQRMELRVLESYGLMAAVFTLSPMLPSKWTCPQTQKFALYTDGLEEIMRFLDPEVLTSRADVSFDGKTVSVCKTDQQPTAAEVLSLPVAREPADWSFPQAGVLATFTIGYALMQHLLAIAEALNADGSGVVEILFSTVDSSLCIGLRKEEDHTLVDEYWFDEHEPHPFWSEDGGGLFDLSVFKDGVSILTEAQLSLVMAGNRFDEQMDWQFTLSESAPCIIEGQLRTPWHMLDDEHTLDHGMIVEFKCHLAPRL